MADPFETKDKIRHANDVDLNWNAIHHTLGKGPTQAAPGNHTHEGLGVTEHRHDAEDIDNLPAPGEGGSDANFVFTQATMSKTWTVNHNLSKRVAVTVEDGGGTTIYGTVKHMSDNQVVVTFAVAVTGRVYCN